MSQTIETPLTDEQKHTLRYVARLIVQGSKGREQGQGRYFGQLGGLDKEKYCCAIGACLIAVNAPQTNSLVLSDWLHIGNWPEINYPENTPAWERWNDALYGEDRIKKPFQLVDVIMQLNDKAKWSFRRIAAYLRLVAQKGIIITTTA